MGKTLKALSSLFALCLFFVLPLEAEPSSSRTWIRYEKAKDRVLSYRLILDEDKNAQLVVQDEVLNLIELSGGKWFLSDASRMVLDLTKTTDGGVELEEVHYVPLGGAYSLELTDMGNSLTLKIIGKASPLTPEHKKGPVTFHDEIHSPWKMEQIKRAVLNYYESQNGGKYPGKAIISEVGPDGVLIQLAQDMGDHVATAGWYLIDPIELTGSDEILGGTVDFSPYAEEVDPFDVKENPFETESQQPEMEQESEETPRTMGALDLPRLEPDNPVLAFCNGSRVNLRDAPSRKGKVLTMLDRRQPLYAMAQEHTGEDFPWVKITTKDGYIGWVYGQYVSFNRSSLREKELFKARFNSTVFFDVKAIRRMTGENGVKKPLSQGEQETPYGEYKILFGGIEVQCFQDGEEDAFNYARCFDGRYSIAGLKVGDEEETLRDFNESMKAFGWEPGGNGPNWVWYLNGRRGDGQIGPVKGFGVDAESGKISRIWWCIYLID